MIRRNVSGVRFGYLVANRPTQVRDRSGGVIWECLCDCGNTKLVSSKLLLSNSTKSCGCQSYHTIDPNRAVKQCSKCKLSLPILNFPKNKTAKDGHSHYCRDCTRIVNSKNCKKESYREGTRIRQSKKYKEDINFRISHGMRNRVRLALRNNSKYGSTLELLGCTIPELRKYLQSQFVGDMTWENYGVVWEIDHIIPCATFDLSTVESQKECFHFSNLRPLGIKENRGRGLYGY